METIVLAPAPFEEMLQTFAKSDAVVDMTLHPLPVEHRSYAKYVASGYTHAHCFACGTKEDVQSQRLAFILEADKIARSSGYSVLLSREEVTPAGVPIAFLRFMPF